MARSSRFTAILFTMCFILLQSPCMLPSEAVSALAIDLGTEFIKVALVSPGVPMDIVLNADSERKTSTAIGFKNGERFFGRDALVLAVRSPTLVFEGIPALIGKSMNHPAVKQFQTRYPYHNISYDETLGQIVFNHLGETIFTVDELVAMLLEHAREIAQRHSEIKLKSCVLTVPMFYGQVERRRLKLAAEMAGLKITQLINSNTAVSLNFILFRQSILSDSPKHFLFYDVGSTSTVASVTTYQRLPKESTSSYSVTVKGVGFDSTLGTSVFIYRLRDLLVTRFLAQKKHLKGDITKNYRSMAKLTQEAGRILIKLSANLEIMAEIDELFEGEDLRIKVTRSDMEEACADLFERLRKPLHDAIESSNLTVSSIEEIVLMGGGTRIPKVQEVILSVSQKSELGRGVNNDEAAVLGAAFKSASLTSNFRVVKIDVKDYNLYPISVGFDRAPIPEAERNAGDPSSSANESPFVQKTLFPKGASYPERRVLTFNRHTNDLTFFINYGNLLDSEARLLGSSNNLSTVTTTSIHQSIKQNPDTAIHEIKAHFRLDESGILNMTGIDGLFHPTTKVVREPSTLERMKNAAFGLFGAGDSAQAKPNTTQNETDATPPEMPKNQSDPVTNLTETPSDTSESKIQARANFSLPIEFSETLFGSPDLTDAAISAIRQKLIFYGNADKLKVAREKSINEVESAILRASEQISDSFKQYATVEELQQLETVVMETSVWFDEQDLHTKKEEYDVKLALLQKHLIPIEQRLKEANARPGALKALNDSIMEAEKFYDSIKTLPNTADTDLNATENEKAIQSLMKNIFTQVEIDKLSNLINSTQKWSAEILDKLAKTPLTQKPPVSVRAMQMKQDELMREVNYLRNKLEIRNQEIIRLLEAQARAEALKKEAEARADQDKASKDEKVPETTEQPPIDNATTAAPSTDKPVEQPSTEQPTTEKPTRTEHVEL